MSVGQRGLPCMTTLTFANSAINVSLCPIAYLMASSGRRICFVGMRYPTCALRYGGITAAPPHLRPAQQRHHSGKFQPRLIFSSTSKSRAAITALSSACCLRYRLKVFSEECPVIAMIELIGTLAA